MRTIERRMIIVRRVDGAHPMPDDESFVVWMARIQCRMMSHSSCGYPTPDDESSGSWRKNRAGENSMNRVGDRGAQIIAPREC